MPIYNETFWSPRSLEGRDLAEGLARSLERIRAAHYDAESCRMAYSRLAASPEFTEFALLTRALSKYDLSALATPAAQKAFWLNAHNALALHAAVAGKVAGSVRDVDGFFEESRYRIGGHALSLDDIAHGILRGNAKKYRATGAQFGSDDPRRPLAMIQPDLRVHFGLYSPSAGSPPLRIYRPDDVDAKLESSGVHFVRRFVRAERNGKVLGVPPLFFCYAGDFGGEERIVRFIAECVSVPGLAQALRAGAAGTRLDILDHDWSLNDLSGALRPPP
jgi:hypothetical protein